MNSHDKQVNTVDCNFLPQTLYSRRVARTYIIAVQDGTALIVLIQSIRLKAHGIAISHLFPVLHVHVQNCKDLPIKHNIDSVSTDYPRHPKQNLA